MPESYDSAQWVNKCGCGSISGDLKEKERFSYSSETDQVSSTHPSESSESLLGFLKVFHPNHLNCSFNMLQSTQRCSGGSFSLCYLAIHWRQGLLQTIISQFQKHRAQASGCLTPFTKNDEGITTHSEVWQT